MSHGSPDKQEQSLCKEIYCKELVHIVMEAENFKVCNVGQQRDPGERIM